MKKVIGKVLLSIGGFLCVVCTLCTPLAFTGDDNTFGERIILLFLFLGMAAFNGLICWLGSRQENEQTPGIKQPEQRKNRKHPGNG